MSNWDLMMPGMGLTSIGLAGVVLAYAEIAHTFIDGLHALAGLTMFVGLIILAVGILDGGVSTSNRAKATVLVILSISLGFGAYAFTFNTISTSATFAGILMAIAAPATIIAYISMKHTGFVKPVAAIFILGSVAGIAAFVGFGLVGPSPYLIPEEIEEAEEPAVAAVVPPDLSGYRIAILEGSSLQGVPDYDPDVATVPRGETVVWYNEDSVVHTSTAEDFEPFDTELIMPGGEYRLNTTSIEAGEYPYLCIVHPWMTSVLIIEDVEAADGEPAGAAADGERPETGAGEPAMTAGTAETTDVIDVEDAMGEPAAAEVSIPEGSGFVEPGAIYYDPQTIKVETGTAVSWTNDDTVAHTVSSGSIETGQTDLFDSGIMAAGAVYERTFEEAGEYEYFCALHPWMGGTVEVAEAPDDANDGAAMAMTSVATPDAAATAQAVQDWHPAYR